MAKKIAVIDLGTNTFHILIVEMDSNHSSWKEIYRERKYIHLAEDGIDTIGMKAFQRGIDALQSFSKTCRSHQVTKIKACGTAALRTASNGSQFVEKAKNLCGLSIETIDGLKEANYIALGVQLAVPQSQRSKLIMDIGGGSVEFILVRNQKLVWSQSFPIGVAVLKKKFHHSDPISADELNNLKSFLGKHLAPLKSILNSESSLDLIGASGTFDVLQKMISQLDFGKNFSHLELNEFEPLAKELIHMDLMKRNIFPNLPTERAELIVVALILIQHILQIHSFQNLFVSNYAMKEGILSGFKKS